MTEILLIEKRSDNTLPVGYFPCELSLWAQEFTTTTLLLVVIEVGVEELHQGQLTDRSNFSVTPWTPVDSDN